MNRPSPAEEGTGIPDLPPIRVLIAKAGLDGHDRGALVVTRALRDAGMEVVYTGIRQTPEQIARAALQEDVDVVGLSSLSGAHAHLFPRVTEALRRLGREKVVVVGGGVIPEEDIPALREAGVEAVFTPGASLQAIVAFIRQRAGKVEDRE
ncbi:MAG TPA: cobalamin B12-binding domain-containing protein [Bacillota bacterium]|nr:cobalamin B12-binding domain-containing protein [Bacillota bacterium]